MTAHWTVSARGLVLLGLLAALAVPAQGQGGFPPFPPVVAPPENPITPQKAILGKFLFWEEQLSDDNTMACGTCHKPSAGGSDSRVSEANRHPGLDGLPLTADDTFGSNGVRSYDENGHFQPDLLFGFDPQVTSRVSQSVINAWAYDHNFWDGRAEGAFTPPGAPSPTIPSGGMLEIQVLAPILNAVEMGHVGQTWSEVTTKLEELRPLKLASSYPQDMVDWLATHPSYPSMFLAAFGTRDITPERIARAIATYERTLVSDSSPWDDFIAGDTSALTADQQAGWAIFQSAGCVDCHAPPFFSDKSFRNIGVRPIAEDPGRMGVTGLFEDRGKFRVPSLRNVGLRNRYFHDGLRTSLNAIVNFYNSGGIETENKDPLIVPLSLDSTERDQLLQFLSGGLDDFRVQWELGVFSRPRLHSENGPPPANLLAGTGTPGTGGFLPEILVHSPPSQGTPGYRIGLKSGLGGTRALLVITDPQTGGAPSVTIGNVTYWGVTSRTYTHLLNGTGAGNGYTTRPLPIPAINALSGQTLQAQWFVFDPAAPGGFAKSEIAEITFF